VDDATRRWIAEEIKRRGGVVEELPYEFDQYVVTVRVTAGGNEVPAVPLFYSGVGEVDTAEPYVAEIDPAVTSADADEALGVARATGFRVAVLATREASGRLVGINRAPVAPPGPIAVLVPGEAIDALQRGSVHVRVNARVALGTSATVVGRFARKKRFAASPPIVIATPLTGWFGCAGERGTGIAVALELAHRLAAKRSVLLVATTGHEIGFIGMHDFLARTEVDACAVLQLGASVAATSGEGAALRVALVDHLDPGRDAQLDDALEPSGFRTVRHDGSWPTEGDGWRGRGIPVVSYVGFFDGFHTPDDVPAAVTSPAFLDAVAGALLAATRIVLA
jgi:hypothetical protein